MDHGCQQLLTCGITVLLHLGGSVSFGSSEYSALEGAGSVAVTVELSVATEIDVVVELVTSAATASSKQ